MKTKEGLKAAFFKAKGEVTISKEALKVKLQMFNADTEQLTREFVTEHCKDLYEYRPLLNKLILVGKYSQEALQALTNLENAIGLVPDQLERTLENYEINKL